MSVHLHRLGVACAAAAWTIARSTTPSASTKTGQSLGRIRDRYNVDPTTVHTALRTRGVRLRDTHGRDR
ncbi:MAG TPA: hypothetical protein VI248_07435 [Kineosporiaceae bacterium]